MRQPWRRAAIAALGPLLLGAATGRILLDSMNDPDEAVQGALARSADPDSAPPAGPRGRTARLVIVVLDGLGEEAFLEQAPRVGLGPERWHFRATVDSGTPSLSKPAYHVLLTGVPQAVSGIRNNAYPGMARAPDLAASVRASGGTVGWGLETVPWFHDLFGEPADTLERVRQEPFLDGLFERAPASKPPDPFAAMGRVLSDNPTLAVLHATGVDAAGHRHGAESQEYKEIAQETLRRTIALHDAHAATPAGADSVWMIGADHGHLPGGGHGGPEIAVRRTAWIGLWPREIARKVEIPGAVPAERLASTFAAILGVSPPRAAMGDPLDLPDRAPSPVDSASTAALRRTPVRDVLDRQTGEARRGITARAGAIAVALLAVAAVLLRRGQGRPFLAAAAPALGACAGFLALGPGLTLSAIRTHLGFLSQSLAAMAVGAALLHALVGRWRPPATWAVGAAAVLPAAALAITAGSMGRSHVPDSLLLVLPASGIVPWGVVLGLGAVHAVRGLVDRRGRRTPVGAAASGVAPPAQAGPGDLHDA